MKMIIQRISIYTYPLSPVFNNLLQNGTFVTINESILIHYYSTILYSDFCSSFFFFSLFCSKKGSRIPHYGWLSYLLRLFLSLIVSQTFLVFDNFNRFEECWSCICRISLIWEHEFFWKSDSATRHVIGKVAQKLHSRNYSFFLLLLLILPSLYTLCLEDAFGAPLIPPALPL